jgi:hypothetical protein
MFSARLAAATVSDTRHRLPFLVYVDEDRSISNDAGIRAMIQSIGGTVERRNVGCLTSICKAGSLGS